MADTKYLSGFVASDGTYTECLTYAHMDTATEIVEQLFPHDLKYSGIQNEDCLINEKAYIALYARGAAFDNYDYPLTKEQREFLENAVPNNDEQKKAINRILELDREMHEGSILSRYEEKVLKG